MRCVHCLPSLSSAEVEIGVPAAAGELPVKDVGIATRRFVIECDRKKAMGNVKEKERAEMERRRIHGPLG
jgi:hypothetical protein